ncbi:MAG: molybdopterin molybdotransferase MoeA [Candidatus Velthaea sp.]|jgi:molybdopterin molybdotransferase
MRSTQALLPGATFEPSQLPAPLQALGAYQAAVGLGPVGIESVPLAAAFGRILAADAVAHEEFPAQSRSTMDGFAVRSADGAQPRRIVGEVRMGLAPPSAVGEGEAIRIPTGGTLPGGADAVVPIEDADAAGEVMQVRAAPEAGQYFTPAGSDMTAGQVAIGAGSRIGGPELGVLATLGEILVPVFRRPRFAIISTGDELVDAALVPGIGQVRDSNRWAIAGTLAALGADVLHLPKARDDVDALRVALAAGLARADAVILSGGSSVGERDLTPDAIATFPGPGVIVHGMRVKPGKPTVLAAVGIKPVIGLPGNPVSALTILEAVCAPLVRAMTGERAARAAVVATVAGAPFSGRAGWTTYAPAELRRDAAGERAFPLALRSAHTSLLARASGYVVLTEERWEIAVGEALDLVRFSGGAR